MRLDHPNYIKLAIAAYHEKLLNNELSPLLMHSTPANIRRECVTVYQERYDKKDEPMLRAFFGSAEQGRKFQALIENYDVNRFKPLNNYLREQGKKDSTEKLQGEDRRSITERNLELLAWLIDFKHRPYKFGMEIFLTEKERQILGMESLVDNSGKSGINSIAEPTMNAGQNLGATLPTESKEKKNDPGKEDGKTPAIIIINTDDAAAKDGVKPLPNPALKKRVAVGLISATLLGAIYIGSKVIGTAKEGCMYWAGDHYEKVSCDTIIKDRPTLSFDKSLENLRLITQTDTISEWSIGKVHYIKDSGVKFYTGAGLYPEDPTRPLKKLTRYMFDKYLRSKKDTGKYASAEINRSN